MEVRPLPLQKGEQEIHSAKPRDIQVACHKRCRRWGGNRHDEDATGGSTLHLPKPKEIEFLSAQKLQKGCTIEGTKGESWNKASASPVKKWVMAKRLLLTGGGRP